MLLPKSCISEISEKIMSKLNLRLRNIQDKNLLLPSDNDIINRQIHDCDITTTDVALVT